MTTLKWSGQGWTDHNLSEEIGLLSQTALDSVQVLDLSNNKLVDPWSALLSFKDLRILHLSANKIRVVPDSVAQWKLLEVLYLDDNELVKLSKAMQNLTKLQWLSLSENSDLPDDLQWDTNGPAATQRQLARIQ